MGEEYMEDPDRQPLKAQRAVRCFIDKMLRLGLSEQEMIEMVRDAFKANRSTGLDVKRSRFGREGRLKRAQDAIRHLIIIKKLNESEIAGMVGVSPSAIAHILSPHDGRSVSEELTSALEALVLKVKVLETCNASGEQLDS